MKVEDIEDVDSFLDELFHINSTVKSPTIEEFELTFAPEMKQKKVKGDTATKCSITKQRNNKPKRCPDTIDFIEVEFGDKYQKCKGSGY